MNRFKPFTKNIPKEKILATAIGVVFLLLFYTYIWYTEKYVNAEIAMPKYEAMKQQLEGINLINTSQPLVSLLKTRYRGERAWLDGKYEIKLKKEEIIKYYDYELKKNGWQQFTLEEELDNRTGEKTADRYISRKNEFEFNLYFLKSLESGSNWGLTGYFILVYPPKKF